MNDINRIQQAVERALAEDTSGRAAFLAELAQEDETLHQEVTRLLAVDDGDVDFLDAPLSRLDEDGPQPDMIGDYDILEPLGRGGMGTVYLAVNQKDELSRKVALKVLKKGMDTADIVRRFRNERRILASLQHPNIAGLISGGTTGDGRPYFVMEHVEGEPLHHFCNQHALSTEKRIELFRKVCQAVHFAHRSLVVHRDIKPSNILVTADGEPKLLDFGISKLLSEDDEVTHLYTRTGFRMMTPEYAAPEQIRGDMITTATDVYALGTVLYELLTGHRPHRFKRRSPAEIERVICDTYPEKPSSVVMRALTRHDTGGGTSIVGPKHVAEQQARAVRGLQRRLSGDLDTIVMKSLRKEPERRYASAEQMSADLGRFLDGYPILARKETLAYTLRKLVSRNRTGFAAAMVMTLLLGGLFGAWWSQRQRAMEVTERRDNAMELILSSVHLLDTSRGLYGADRGRLRAQIQELLTSGLDQDPLQTLRVLTALAAVQLNNGEVLASLKTLDELPAMASASPEIRLLQAQAYLTRAQALAYRARFEESDAAFAQAHAIQSELLPDDHPDLGVTQTAMANPLFLNEDRNHSLAQLREAEAALASAGEAYSYHFLENRLFQVMHRIRLGDAPEPDEGADLLREISARGYDNSLLQAAAQAIQLELILVAGDVHIFRAEDAYVTKLQEIHRIFQRLEGVKHPLLADVYNAFGIRSQALHPNIGLQYFERGLQMRRETQGENHPMMSESYYLIGRFILGLGRYQQSLAYLEQSVERFNEHTLPLGGMPLHMMLVRVGENQIYLGRYQEAERYLLQGLEERKAIENERSRTIMVSHAMVNLSRLYLRWGRFPESEQYGDEAWTMRRSAEISDYFTQAARRFALEARLAQGQLDVVRTEIDAMRKEFLVAFEGERRRDMLALPDYLDGLYYARIQRWSRALQRNRAAMRRVEHSHVIPKLMLEDIYQRQGEILQAMGQKQSAKDWFALASDVSDPMGLVRRQQGRYP